MLWLIIATRLKAKDVKKIICAILCLSTLWAQDELGEYFKLLYAKKNVEFEKLQNPFLNPTFEKIKNLKLVAIMFNKAKINDKWYEKGDQIDGAIILEINTKEIIVEYDAVKFKIGFRNNVKVDIY